MLPDATPRKLDGAIIWSAVNFSEGRRGGVIEEILSAARSGATVADWSADFDHNRMVATLLGDAESVARSVMAAAGAAVERIDLREHSGVHPRVGAVDVVPLVPAHGLTMAECVEASIQLGRRLAELYDLPVYLYEESARKGGRASLPEIRKGGFEGLFVAPLVGDRAPDFGPSTPHPTAGAVVLGARNPLTAFNVNLDSADVSTARSIAAAIRRERAENPVLMGVRALGLSLPSRGMSQVSMNLTIPLLTPIPGVFEYVQGLALEFGVEVVESEVIGLIPRAALLGRTPESILWRGYRERQILEEWIG